MNKTRLEELKREVRNETEEQRKTRESIIKYEASIQEFNDALKELELVAKRLGFLSKEILSEHDCHAGPEDSCRCSEITSTI